MQNPIDTTDFSESGRQFAEIFEEHHNPDKREEREMKLRREKRAERIGLDVGL